MRDPVLHCQDGIRTFRIEFNKEIKRLEALSRKAVAKIFLEAEYKKLTYLAKAPSQRLLLTKGDSSTTAGFGANAITPDIRF